MLCRLPCGSGLELMIFASPGDVGQAPRYRPALTAESAIPVDPSDSFVEKTALRPTFHKSPRSFVSGNEIVA
jgi:hypothetical protein